MVSKIQRVLMVNLEISQTLAEAMVWASPRFVNVYLCTQGETICGFILKVPKVYPLFVPIFQSARA